MGYYTNEVLWEIWWMSLQPWQQFGKRLVLGGLGCWSEMFRRGRGGLPTLTYQTVTYKSVQTIWKPFHLFVSGPGCWILRLPLRCWTEHLWHWKVVLKTEVCAPFLAWLYYISYRRNYRIRKEEKISSPWCDPRRLSRGGRRGGWSDTSGFIKIKSNCLNFWAFFLFDTFLNFAAFRDLFWWISERMKDKTHATFD